MKTPIAQTCSFMSTLIQDKRKKQASQRQANIFLAGEREKKSRIHLSTPLILFSRWRPDAESKVDTTKVDRECCTNF